MNRATRICSGRAALACVCAALVAGCGRASPPDPETGAPPAATVEQETTEGDLRVPHPERFSLATVGARQAASELAVTGTVSPDVSRAVPVVSLSSGRVVEVRAHLGDQVKRGQLLLRIQSADVSAALSDYQKALADQQLSEKQLDRASALFDRGAIAQKDLEVAQNATTKSAVDVKNSAAHLSLLGGDPNQPPTGIVDIRAPVSGVITEQNVTNAAGVKTLDNSPNLFTISDLSQVWVICDVFENDLPFIREGDKADIHLAAYPDRVLQGRIDNIGPILDPNIRTAKVRIDVANSGILRIGMFATAIVRGHTTEQRSVVPAAAVLHLHDRDWVYVSIGAGRFQRKEVRAGEMRPEHMQDIVSGLEPGQRVVWNALTFQDAVEQ